MSDGASGQNSGASGAAFDLTEDLTAIHLRWFDRWRRLADWPPANMRSESWYLQPGKLLAREPQAAASAVHYTYDPDDPVPTRGGTGLFPGLYAAGVRDQAPLSARPDVLTFSSAPLEAPYTIMGPVSAELWAGSSAPDTDFVARLVDVNPDGYLHNLCDGIVRARYRDSLTEPKWLEAGRAYPFHIDLWSTAHTFKPGHRIGLQVTSSNFPRYDRNLNTADPPGTGVRGVKVEQTVWMGDARPSRLQLPVVPGP